MQDRLEGDEGRGREKNKKATGVVWVCEISD